MKRNLKIPPPIISRSINHYVNIAERKDKVAFVDGNGSHTYGNLSHNSKILANGVKNLLGSKRARNSNKVSFLCENDSSYIKTLLGIWEAGQVAVPLCKSHPSQTLEYYVNDSESVAVIATESQINKVMPFAKDCENVELVAYEELMGAGTEDGVFSNVNPNFTLLA
jgi:malonyl-CoA/methylmalonyl-CoA synthetase